MNHKKPILCLDFDGVIHSYTSGWKGPRNIPDPPVPEALPFIANAMQHFDVQIFSSRSRYWFGRRAMKQWLIKHLVELAPDWETTPPWWRFIIAETVFADPWDYEVYYAAKCFVGKIGFPLAKPPAMVTIDDRAIRFMGTWPTMEYLKGFRPWYKGGI